MTTVISTGQTSKTTAWSNQRNIDRCQNGVLWALFTPQNSAAIEGAYSTDGGDTWSVSNQFNMTNTGIFVPNLSFFIDLDDYAHVVYVDSYTGELKYRRGTPNAARTSYSWSSQFTLSDFGDHGNMPDLVAHRDGSGWAVHIVASYRDSPASRDLVYYAPLAVSSGGTISYVISGSVQIWSLSPSYGNSLHKFPSIDFHHTGDGKTIKDGTPDLYVAWSSGDNTDGIRFLKWDYAADAWNDERAIDTGRYVLNADLHWLNCLFDGTRVILVGLLRGALINDLVAHERDAADTTTTTRVLIGGATDEDALATGSATYDDNGDIHMFGVDADDSPSHPFYRRKWVRDTATLEAAQTEGGTVELDTTYASARRGSDGGRVDYVRMDDASAPYDIIYGGIPVVDPDAIDPNDVNVHLSGSMATKTTKVKIGGSFVTKPVAVKAAGAF